MGIGTFIKNFMSSKAEPKEDLPDDVTKDKVLRTLRRQRRIQLEEQEKIRLRRQIMEYNRNRDKKGIYGIGEKSLLKEGKNFASGRFKKEKYMFGNKKPLLKQKNGRFL